MTSKYVNHFIIFLIVVYTILIFVTLAIEDMLSDGTEKD